MNCKKPQMAICYDFDGTLSPGWMQNYDFMRALGEDPKEFWHKAHQLARKQQADDIAAYMQLMVAESQKKKVSLTRKAFQAFGKDIPLYAGLNTWFDRTCLYAQKKGILLRHYIISSGIKEMIEGTPIAKKFQNIFACSFMYNSKRAAIWPAVVLNYTSKTQFLFRINKGCEDITDNTSVNQYTPLQKRPVPFQNMVYIGDGQTDVPCMKMVYQNGGHSVAVYNPQDKQPSKDTLNLMAEKRVNAVLPADYRAQKTLEKYIFAVIDKVAADTQLENYEKGE